MLIVNAQPTISSIEIKIRDITRGTQAIWQKMLNTLRKGETTDFLSNTNGHQTESIDEKLLLLQEEVESKERCVIQEEKRVDVRRAKLAQLARKQDHYAGIKAIIEEEGNRIGEGDASYCAAVKQQKFILSNSGQAGQAFLQMAITNRMSPSDFAEFYEKAVEKLRKMAGFIDQRKACKPNCGECKKYKMDRCWWCRRIYVQRVLGRMTWMIALLPVDSLDVVESKLEFLSLTLIDYIVLYYGGDSGGQGTTKS